MINIGDDVYVPRSRLGINPDGPSALVKTRVRNRHKRTLTVDVPGLNGQSRDIPSSSAHKGLAIYVITVGDYATETSVLLPLRSSPSAIVSAIQAYAKINANGRAGVKPRSFWTLDLRASGLTNNLLLHRLIRRSEDKGTALDLRAEDSPASRLAEDYRVEFRTTRICRASTCSCAPQPGDTTVRRQKFRLTNPGTR
jgi:hypothetical protein